MYHQPFSQTIPRLGGMYILISFVGAVGTLIAETRLAEIIETVFEKKFPTNMKVGVADEVLGVLI